MIIKLPNPNTPIRVFLQRAGYTEFRDPHDGEISYTRRLGTHFYPRFHVYAVERQQELELRLHLDQKQPSYPGFTKHSGEYNGDLVQKEGERLAAAVPV